MEDKELREKIDKLIREGGEFPEDDIKAEDWDEAWVIHDPVTITLTADRILQLIQTEKQAVALDIINAWEHHETPSGLLTEHVGTWGVKIEKLKTKYALPKENNEK